MQLHRMNYAALFVALILSTQIAYAGANPYTGWASFKVGSSSTLSGDLDIDNVRVHREIVQTLISASDDQVVIQTVIKHTTHDRQEILPAIYTTIADSSAANDIKEVGNRELVAIGKTFHCKIWDATGESPNDATHSGMGDADNGSKAITYLSAEVPGGVVERDSVDQNGKQVNFVLTAMFVKH